MTEFTVGRRGLLGGLAATSAIPAVAMPRRGKAPPPNTIWATAIDALDYAVSDQTVRLAVRVTCGARRIRIRLSNAYGTAPLAIASLHVGLRERGARVRSGTNRAGAFVGDSAITIPTGASVVSDPIALDLRAGTDLLVSVSVRGKPAVVTGHLRPKDSSWLSQPGDHGAEEAPDAFTSEAAHWFFVDAITGEGMPNAGSVAILGDSITDSGSLPRGGYQGWVDLLAARIAALPQARQLGLVNAGISGNRMTAERPGAGINALARLDRDVLSHAGVHTLIVFEGINDIYGTPIGADALILAHAQIATRARLAGLRVLGGTLLPTRRDGFTPERESVRAALNAHIRTSRLYDGVIDFERAVADPADRLALAPAYDSGDRLHPSAAGYRAMAAAVPLALLYR